MCSLNDVKSHTPRMAMGCSRGSCSQPTAEAACLNFDCKVTINMTVTSDNNIFTTLVERSVLTPSLLSRAQIPTNKKIYRVRVEVTDTKVR